MLFLFKNYSFPIVREKKCFTPGQVGEEVGAPPPSPLPLLGSLQKSFKTLASFLSAF